MTKSTQASSNKITINHMYDLYELYAVMYSRDYAWKAAEARGLSYVMTQAAIRSKKLLAQGKKAYDYAKNGFNVLEVFSGKGEHLPHVKLPKDLTLKSYTHNDLRNHTGVATNFVQGDALTTKFDGHNFACALFYSMSSLHDEHGSHNRKYLIQLFKNMYDSLPEGGCFFVDFCPDGYRLSLSVESTDNEDMAEITVDPNADLRERFNIPFDVECKLRYKKHVYYDRSLAQCFDQFTTPVSIMVGNKTVASITIEEPMTQRYFSEAELADIAREAGFKDFMFFDLNYSNSDFSVAENIVESDEGIETEEADGYMVNGMMVIK
jgi:hypothetical protein